MTGWLVPEAQRELTPSCRRRRTAAELVVFHWTASPALDYRARGGADGRRIRRWLAQGGSLGADGALRAASTHFAILRDGTVIQGAPLDRVTWHAGESAWRGRSGVNAFSLGIDLENVGPLRLTDAGFRDSYGGTYEGPRPYSTPEGHFFEPYTEAQVDALCSLAVDLVSALPVLGDPSRWVGHRDVSPGRKSDPGPAMKWRRLRGVIRAAAAGECLDVEVDG